MNWQSMIPSGLLLRDTDNALGDATAGDSTAAMLRELAATPGTPDAIAHDEPYWRIVRRAFDLDERYVNLESGGGSPSPRIVQETLKRRLDYSNSIPPIARWRVLEPQREIVRRRLARAWGVSPDEIAITRSASEGLQICQCGISLSPGDEVLTTDQDYPRMLWTYQQRAHREGIVLRTISIPVPCNEPNEIVRRVANAITPRTRIVHLSHIINLSGQVMPIRAVGDLLHDRGIAFIVDGAHSFAHLDFKIADLHCDFYAASLHKWLCAPHGTGVLYVRRDRIENLWPLTAAPEPRSGDIRKFEEIGTYDVAPILGIAEAQAFHQAIGPLRKQMRLLHLRNYWMNRLKALPRIHWNSTPNPTAGCGMGNFDIAGINLHTLKQWLQDEHQIVVHVTEHPDYRGIRVSPNVFTTPEELDRFCDAVESVTHAGIRQ